SWCSAGASGPVTPVVVMSAGSLVCRAVGRTLRAVLVGQGQNGCMPEGHTLHALARDLTGAFAGTIPEVTSPQGRFAEGAALLDGHELVGARAWGKLLFVEFAAERILHVHLGLIGKFPV